MEVMATHEYTGVSGIHITRKKLRFNEDFLRTVLATLLALCVYIIVCVVLLCMSVKITSQESQVE